jgi:hypothetical protein
MTYPLVEQNPNLGLTILESRQAFSAASTYIIDRETWFVLLLNIKSVLHSSTTSHISSRPTSNKMGDNWLSKQVQGYVAGAGKVAGSLVYGVGNGINNVGKGIGNR